MAVKGYQQHLANLTKDKKKIYSIFVNETDDVASVVADLNILSSAQGKAKITVASKAKLEEAVNLAASSIKKSVDKVIKSDLTTSIGLVKNPVDSVMIADMKTYLQLEILEDLEREATLYVYNSQFEKVYKNAEGKITNYTNSLGGIPNRYKRDVKFLLEQGLLEGRSNVELAKDLQLYARGGKASLLNRSPKYNNAQISKKVDWKALRLARTTIQGGVQDGLIVSYETAPSVKGFDWVLSPLHNRYSICEDIVAGNPWTYDNFTYGNPPHPNCQSSVSPRNMPRKQFLKDLKSWGNGSTVGYLDDWYGKYYVPTERGMPITFDKLLNNNKRNAA